MPEELSTEESYSTGTNISNPTDYIPYTYIHILHIQNMKTDKQPYLVLLDSGSTISWIARQALSDDIEVTTTKPQTGATMSGTFTSNKQVVLNGIRLPEFNNTLSDIPLHTRIIETDCRYDLIMGRDFLRNIGVTLDFEKHIMVSSQLTVPMREYKYPNPKSLIESILKNTKDNYYGDDNDDNLASAYKSKTIKSNDYGKETVAEIIDKQNHLSDEKKKQLLEVASAFPELFDGKLKAFKGYEIELELKDDAKPHASRAYPVPRIQLPIFKRELNELVNQGVLEKAERSEWIAGTFIIPKKDGKVRWITDFRALNRAIKRRIYPIPKIQDILSRRSGYKYVICLDLTRHYYTFVLKDTSRYLTTIATPFGLFRYKRLPQGICIGPDVAQEAMENLLRHIDGVEVYFDDIAIFAESWDDLIKTLFQVLKILNDNGFAVNAMKTVWAKQEVEFLGHLLTPSGIKPVERKVNAIVKMSRPTCLKELRAFLGLVTYYRDMWPKRSHILAPLTDLLGIKKYHWSDDCELAFKKMKALVCKETLLRYPDSNKPYYIKTDASDYQLGGVILQLCSKTNKLVPIAYYTRKLNPAQKNYTTIEKELLSIVEIFKEFHTILFGGRIIVFTDHKNLTHDMSQYTTQRVLRWRLLLEEFGPEFKYIRGEDNVVADALSRVPIGEAGVINNSDSFFNSFAHYSTISTDLAMTLYYLDDDNYANTALGSVDDRSAMPKCDALVDDVYGTECSKPRDKTVPEDVSDVFLLYPVFDTNLGYCDFKTIAKYQKEDNDIQDALKTNPNLFVQDLNGHKLVCLRPTGGNPNWKILLPTLMMPFLIKWYHDTLLHTEGSERVYASISRYFVHPNLKADVETFINSCELCQRMKTGIRNKGHLAPRQVPLIPWQEVQVDCCGNWVIRVNKHTLKFQALTVIDTVTNLLEIVEIPDRKSRTVARAFDNTWLARYPRPSRTVHDRGPEFVGHEFQYLLQQAGITSRPITPRNPQSNGIVERVHQVVAQVIRTYIALKPPQTPAEAQEIIQDALATAMHATRCSANSSLRYLSPGSIAFNRDMLLDIPFQADLIMLQQKRQQQIDNRLIRENSKRKFYDYQPGQQVYVLRDRNSKIDAVFDGPYVIERVHTNGTVTIRLNPTTVDRVNIRLLKPSK